MESAEELTVSIVIATDQISQVGKDSMMWEESSYRMWNLQK